MLCSVDLVALTRELAAGRVLRNPSAGKTGLVGPLIRVLGLPRLGKRHLASLYMLTTQRTYPLNPALGSTLEGVDLRLPELGQERLEARAERRSLASQASAAANSGGTAVGAVITRANPTSIEVLG